MSLLAKSLQPSSFSSDRTVRHHAAQVARRRAASAACSSSCNPLLNPPVALCGFWQFLHICKIDQLNLPQFRSWRSKSHGTPNAMN